MTSTTAIRTISTLTARERSSLHTSAKAFNVAERSGPVIDPDHSAGRGFPFDCDSGSPPHRAVISPNSYGILIKSGPFSPRIYMPPPCISLPLGSEFSPCLTSFSSPQAVPWSPWRSLTPTPATVCKERPMTLDYILGAIVTLGIFGYLVFALIRPERF